MFEILEKRRLSSQVVLMKIDAPLIAKKAMAGQFIMLRVDADGERIPLTVADYDRESGTITIIFQEIGKTTMQLGTFNEGDYINDFAGPLGVASHLEGLKKVCVIGGGLGCAIAYPQAKALFDMGAHVDVIAGFRNEELIILEDEFKDASTNLFICTDDGSNGKKALVTDILKELIEQGNKYDMVITIGPLIMMKFVCLATKPHGIKTIVSMNSTMIDGTGMCGGCRITVDGKVKFACVDGPDFDGHLVDFDEAMKRSAMYKPQEQKAIEHHKCKMEGKE